MTAPSRRLHLPAGTMTDGRWCTSIAPEAAGWDFAGLRIADLPSGTDISFITGADEAIVLPLAGACSVDCDGERLELAGRASVFSGVTDFAYLPRDCTARLSTTGGGRFAVATARARQRLTPRYGPAFGVPVELRGAGSCTRLVRNFAMPATFCADRLIACEVITPAGNWSSYPPHKHDQDRPGESVLEEIYYFEIGASAGGAGSGAGGTEPGAGGTEPGAGGTEPGAGGTEPGAGGAGLGFQRVYGTPDRPVDVLAEVRTGDVVLVPHGWHGPSMAAPGYDMYYLNVMAGPAAERAWLACDDPEHAWVRDTWHGQPPDPRLTGADASYRRPR